jgi:hypothetical protein
MTPTTPPSLSPQLDEVFDMLPQQHMGVGIHLGYDQTSHFLPLVRSITRGSAAELHGGVKVGDAVSLVQCKPKWTMRQVFLCRTHT